jgi:NAD(P)-dependent dehydrogenase (short-subunit alcohol dehydrogenase family)
VAEAMSDLFRLDGRFAFVSGAAGHLGRAMSTALCEAGAHVILNGRNQQRVKDFRDALRSKGFSSEHAAFDMTDFANVRAYFSRLPRLDVLVNNAITMTPRPFGEVQAEDFQQTYASSVTAAFEAVRAAQPALANAAAAAGEASVINISSMYGNVSPDARIYSSPEQSSPFHYGPAKAALLQMTRHLAAELGTQRIRVNALTPGPFPRDQVIACDPVFAGRLAARTMLGRTAQAAEIQGPLLFLASRASSFVTGAVIAVDGGWTAW